MWYASFYDAYEIVSYNDIATLQQSNWLQKMVLDLVGILIS